MGANVRFLGLAVGLAALAMTGCGDTHVSLERERIALGKEFLNIFGSVNGPNDLFEKAPQIDSIAARMERLSERRKKLKPATDSEESQMAKLRESEKTEMTALSEKMKASMNPAAMVSEGAPEPAKVQSFMTALMRLNQANLSYDPSFAAAARMNPFGNAGDMPSPGKGGLIAIPPQGADAARP